jgi:pyruvate dehydrogenase E2 component (dihydrolipoamide acetyltransferase)
MPQMGFDMQEGTVVKWRKKEGDQVARGEVIAEIETDKAVVEMEAYAGGVLKKIVAPEGSKVPVESPIAIIGEPGEELPADAASNSAAPAAPSAKAAPTAKVKPDPQAAPAAAPEAPSAPAGEVKVSPLARRIAKEMGVDVTKVKGTGPGGRITEADVRGYKEPAPAAAPAAAAAKAAAPAAPAAKQAAPKPALPTEEKRVPLSRMRQAIAARTVASMREAPHYYVTSELDMGKALELRKELNSSLPEGTRVSVNDMIIRACVLAIQKFPNFNSSIQGNELVIHPNINVGIAIDMEGGLIIAAVSQCQSKDLVGLAKATKDLITRAQSGRLKAEEYTSSTFTVSNMGMLDVDSFTAVINPPNSAVMAVGAVKDKPVVKNGDIGVGKMMKVTVSSDHRVIDGAEAARFLQEVKRLLEHPVLLLI